MTFLSRRPNRSQPSRTADTYDIAHRLVDSCNTPLTAYHTMNRSGGEAFARLAQQLNRARMQAAGGGGKGGGGNPFGNGGKGAATGGGLIALLAVGGIALNYSLFNG